MNQSLKLLSKRERREILGRGNTNLWLLVIVIAVTFLAIAFSNASISYLSLKMDDPFTNWVNVRFGNDVPKDLLADMDDQQTRDRFQIKQFQTDYGNFLRYHGKSGDGSVILNGRFLNNFESSDLIKAILDPSNLVKAAPSIQYDSIPESTLGAILSVDAVEKLHFDIDEMPYFIERSSYSAGADTLGIEVYDGKYAPAPLPVLAIVQRLPDDLDIVSTAFFYEQETMPDGPFNMNNPDYWTEMVYFVSDDIAPTFENDVKQLLEKEGCDNVMTYDITDQMGIMRPAKGGIFLQLFPFGYENDHTVAEYNALDRNIRANFPSQQLYRIPKYRIGTNMEPSFRDYLSVNFSRLDSIRPFEQYMRDNYQVKIDMAQVNSKENFNAVSILANVLSIAMFVFSIVCIVLFIVNMLQSYFQKVKRNMGTFKAFGISTFDLIKVYVYMIFKIIVEALVIALVASWLIEVILPLLGIMKDGRYNYFDLLNVRTLACAVVMIVATIVTVYFTMKSLLRKSPGDLIYDR